LEETPSTILEFRLDSKPPITLNERSSREWLMGLPGDLGGNPLGNTHLKLQIKL
tara:strand:- start:1746 stop:1907 length:162 start_codon:yes stop_codon:yes gene_type:complete